jgi:16S rRNA C967 or C1407 C5-methylase (RsmB/RsmF family)/NOL1/NOP2/fmu family ribosome biogenesis protein
MNHPFPPDFEARLLKDSFLGEELLLALNEKPPVSVRLNPTKQRPNLPFLSAIPWCESAYYLNERPSFTLDPLFHVGTYYPQEAGSMVLDLALKQLPLSDTIKILDLCAAPGGKSTLIASFLNNNGLLVSNEVIQQRARVLTENTTKWGCSNGIVTNNDPKDFERLPHFFDVIVVDAPCSGEGMFRKDQAARLEWSNDAVLLCSGRQKRIVMDVWDALKPGGFLIYSTCTFNELENEQNVDWFLKELDANLIQLQVPKEMKAGRNGIGNYCLPGKVEAEGFYIAVLQKKEGEIRKQKLSRKNEFHWQKDVLDLPNFALLDAHTVFNWNNKLIALPKGKEDEMLHVQAQMRLQKMGTNLGEIARKGVIPNEELALNPRIIRCENTIDVEKQQALKFLHGDTFALAGKHGFQLITYEKEPIGWVKNLGNRCNNLYPKEWRIRMDVS